VRKSRVPVWTQEELLAKEECRLEHKKFLRETKARQDEERTQVRRKIEQDREGRKRDRLSRAARRERIIHVANSPGHHLSPPQASTPEDHKSDTDNISGPSLTKLRLRFLGHSNGPINKTFPVEATLSDVAAAVHKELRVDVAAFVYTVLPPKTWVESEFGMSLGDAGIGQNASLTVKVKDNAGS